MTSPTNIGLTATFDASQAINEFRKYSTVLRSMQQATLAASTAAADLPTKLERGTAARTKTVALYQKLTSLSQSYSTAQQKAAAAEEQGAKSSLQLTQRLRELSTALTKVATTDKETYAAQSRTLGLYSQLISMSAQAALVKQREAAATKSLAQAESRTATKKLTSGGTSAAAANLEQQKKADQEATQATKAATAAEKQRANAVKESANAQDLLANRLASTRYALYQIAAVYGVVGRVALALPAEIIKVATEYDAAFAQVARTTGATSTQLETLKEQIISLGTDIPETFADMSKIASLGAQMGIGSTGLGDFTETVSKFTAASNVAADTAATSFGRLSNLLKIPTEQYKNLGSAVAFLGVNSAATETEILQVAQSIAATGHSAGLSTQTVLGLSSAFASLKVSPEIARSSLQRLFAEIDSAAADGGDQLKKFAQATGLTVDQFKNLRANNPDQMFMKLIQYFAAVQQSGGNLTTVFKDLGIYSIRSAPIYQRLANSIDLVTSSINQAVTSYAQGAYLDKATAPVFDTIQSKATMAQNAVKAFYDSIGESSIVKGGLKVILDGITNILNALDGLPEAVKVGIGAFISIIGLWAAYKAAVALGVAAMTAFRQASDVGLSQTKIGLSELIKEATLAFGTQTKGAQQAAGAMKQDAAATTEATAAVRAHTGAVEADVAALRAQAGAAGAAGTATAVAGTAGARGVAGAAEAGIAGAAGASASAAEKGVSGLLGTVKSLGSSFLKVAGFGLAFSVAMGGIDFLIGKLTEHTESAADRMKRLGEAVLQAGGGVDSFRQALEADADAADDAYAKIVTSVKDMGDGTAQVTKNFVTAGGQTTQLSQETYKLANAVDAGSESQRNAATQIGTTIDKLKQQTIVLGDNAAAWEAGAIRNYLQQTGFTAADYDKLRKNGIDAGSVIARAIKEGADGANAGGGVLGSINGAIDKTQGDLTKLQGKLKDIELEIAKAQGKGSGFAAGGQGGFAIPLPELGTDPKELKGLKDRIAALQSNIDLMTKFRDAVTGGNGAIQQAISNNQVFTDIMQALGIDSDDAADGLGDYSGAADDAAASTETLAERLQDASDQFANLIGQMQDVINNQSNLADAYDNLGKSLANHGADFSILTENGRANMQALSQVVSAYTTILQGQIKSGEITAEQAAQQMQQYMINLVYQLGNIGVPTDQIDYLVKYLGAVTQAKWTIGVGADISGVVDAVNTARQLLDALAADRNVVARSSGQSPAALVAAGTYDQYRTSNKIYTGPTQFAPQNVALPDLNKILNTAVAQQHAENLAQQQEQTQKDLKKAEDEAGDAAKAAGKKQADAAKLASEQLEKQKQYVSDLASYYKGLGGNMFSLVDAEGATYKALQNLGLSITENGKRFNTLTETGRENFSALEDAFDSFGGVLSVQVQNGMLSASQASNQFQQFASGVYSELIKLGVPMKDIKAFFDAIGINTSGWAKAAKGVKQFGGTVTAAAKAARDAADETDKANEKLQTNADKLADYVSRLSDALNGAYSRMYGVGEAADATASAWQALRDRMQDAADSVKQLREENEQLQQSIAEQQVVANKAYIEYRLSLKYGEKDRAADYKQQYDAAKAKVKQDQEQVKENDKQIKHIQANSKELKGNSKEAIANRNSLRDLTKTMGAQIEAYAKAGHTQQEVKRYADRLKDSFAKQAAQLGYSKDEIQPYINKFDDYIDTINTVPKVVKTAIETTHTTTSKTKGVDSSKRALNSIPKRATFRTTATTYHVDVVKRVLRSIPKRANYKVTATTSNVGDVKRKLAGVKGHRVDIPVHVPKNIKIPIKVPTVHGAKINIDQRWLRQQWNNFVDVLSKRSVANPGVVGNPFIRLPAWRGGLVGSFYDGGLVPGTPPANPQQDNLLAKGPDGMYSIRSREYIQPQKAVDYYGLPFMNAVRNLTYQPPGFNAGGLFGNTPAGVLGGSGLGNMLIVQLSPEDRRLIGKIGDQPVVLRLSDRQVADSARRGGISTARTGGA